MQARIRSVGKEKLDLRSHTLGALPIVNSMLSRLGIERYLEEAVASDTRAAMPASAALGVLLRNIIESRTPLYALGEWAGARDRGLLGLSGFTEAAFNDDRVGRGLDRLFDADRAQLATKIALGAIDRFGIALDELHNDSTTITFQGNYSSANGDKVRGKQTVAIKRGHNKDYRPDLKQLLWILTVSSDGAMPVHYRLSDGNTADTDTHTQIWDTLCQLAGRKDFLYVADSKLATRENMVHIDGSGGRFLCVLPRSRKEDSEFRGWVGEGNSPGWVMVRDQTASGAAPDIYLMAEDRSPSAEGFRVAWVLSTSKARRDAESRRSRIKKASDALDELTLRLGGPKARIRTIQGADQATQAILNEARVGQFFDITLAEVADARYRQENRGRPGAQTRYKKRERVRIELSYRIKDEEVHREARADGMFPFITNCRDLSLGQLLDHYKYQPCLERRHEQLKSGMEVAPVLLKSVSRIEALLFLYFVALLVRALIERQIRMRMKDEDLKTLPLYPEDRDCPSPTAERILDIFAAVQRHELFADGELIQVFDPELSPIQRRVLRLLGLSPAIYRSAS